MQARALSSSAHRSAGHTASLSIRRHQSRNSACWTCSLSSTWLASFHRRLADWNWASSYFDCFTPLTFDLWRWLKSRFSPMRTFSSWMRCYCGWLAGCPVGESSADYSNYRRRLWPTKARSAFAADILTPRDWICCLVWSWLKAPYASYCASWPEAW